MLTIKQLADKLGVSKPTITRNKPDDLEFEVIDGVNYINENMERQITEKYCKTKSVTVAIHAMKRTIHHLYNS